MTIYTGEASAEDYLERRHIGQLALEEEVIPPAMRRKRMAIGIPLIDGPLWLLGLELRDGPALWNRSRERGKVAEERPTFPSIFDIGGIRLSQAEFREMMKKDSAARLKECSHDLNNPRRSSTSGCTASGSRDALPGNAGEACSRSCTGAAGRS
jgi:hypothetical protein